MGYDYTRDKLKKLYEQGEYYLGNWTGNGPIYLEKYDEYVQWITGYEQQWAGVKGRYHALFDSSRRDIPIVKGNFVVGTLFPNGEIKGIRAYHLLGAEMFKKLKEAEEEVVSLSCHEETLPQLSGTNEDILEKLEKELAALMQRVEDSFGVPSNFFEKD